MEKQGFKDQLTDLIVEGLQIRSPKKSDSEGFLEWARKIRIETSNLATAQFEK